MVSKNCQTQPVSFRIIAKHEMRNRFKRTGLLFVFLISPCLQILACCFVQISLFFVYVSQIRKESKTLAVRQLIPAAFTKIRKQVQRDLGLPRFQAFCGQVYLGIGIWRAGTNDLMHFRGRNTLLLINDNLDVISMDIADMGLLGRSPRDLLHPASERNGNPSQ